jgi:hypothetical protein
VRFASGRAGGPLHVGSLPRPKVVMSVVMNLDQAATAVGVAAVGVAAVVTMGQGIRLTVLYRTAPSASPHKLRGSYLDMLYIRDEFELQHRSGIGKLYPSPERKKMRRVTTCT